MKQDHAIGGASLTAWELHHQNIAHTIIVDNAGGLLMQRGDVVNKIGTYLKALSAHDNDIPFYVALPTSTIDWTVSDGQEVPIEDRSGMEVIHLQSPNATRELQNIQVTYNSPVLNPSFDLTPTRLVTGFITEFGIFRPDELQSLR